MRKFTFKLMTLLAISLLMPNNANAQSKRTLEAEDYESATSVDWTSPNGKVALGENDAQMGKYAKLDVSGSGNRSAYKSVVYDSEPSGFTSEDLKTQGYVIEFDARIGGGRENNRSQSQFILPTTGPNLASNTTYSGSDYIFALSQPTNTTGKLEKKWFINDLTNSTGETIELNEAWYHYIITVTKTGVSYSIKSGDTEVATGTLVKEYTTLPKITGFFTLLGRTYGYTNFDNLEIYEYSAGVFVNAPIFTLKAVDGNSRIYEITNPNGEGTIYYTDAVLPEAPAINDEAYKTSENTSVDVKISESGNIYAYVLHTDGKNTSSIITQVVEATEITLAKSSVSLKSYTKGTNYLFDVSFIINAPNNSGVLLAPDTETLEYTFTPSGGVESARTKVNAGDEYKPTGNGIIKVYANTSGYKESIFEFPISDFYGIADQSVDYSKVAVPTELSGFTWGDAGATNEDNCKGWTENLPLYLQTSANATSDRLNIQNASTISLIIGWGLVRGDQKSYGFRLRNVVAGNIVAFTQNTSKGTDASANTDKISLCTNGSGQASETITIYTDGGAALQQWTDYAPMSKNINATISAAGYATFSSTYAVDFSKAEGLAAFTAKVNDGNQTITLTKIADGIVPANTGVVLKGDAGEYTGTITTTETTYAENALFANSTEVTGDGATIYVLNKVGVNVGFYPLAEGKTLAAGKAYLQLNSAAKGYTFVWNDGETTGIEENYEFGTMNSDAATFDLSGRKVANPAKGLYIKNGKKFIVK